MRWFPPSWVQITAGSSAVYIDPAYLKTYYKNHSTKIEFSSWPNPIDGLPEDLPPADLILVSHAHKDHCKAVTIRRLRQSGTLIAAPRSCLKELGPDYKTVAAGDKLSLAGIRVKAVPAYNTPEGSSVKKNHKPGQGVGYLISVADRVIYHAGDTDLIPEMAELGPLDAAFLPIGGTYTMNLKEAVEAARVLRPKVVIPIHHLGADPGEFQVLLSREAGIRVALLPIGGGVRIA